MSKLSRLAVVALPLSLGCNQLWGLDDLSYEPASTTGSAGAGGAGGFAGSGGSGASAAAGAGGGGGSQPGLTGELLWGVRFGDDGNDRGVSVAVDPSGSVVQVGHFRGSITLGTETLVNSGTGFTDDVLVAKLSSDGDVLWAASYGDAADQDPADVAVDTDGAIIVVGGFNGSIDFGGAVGTATGRDAFVVKLDAAGVHQWTVYAGGADSQVGQAVAADAAGNAVVVGQFAGAIDFGLGPLTDGGESDVFVVKLDPDGAPQWNHRISGPGSQTPRTVAVGTDGSVAVIGRTVGAVDLGSVVLPGVAGDDLYLVKYASGGALQWAKLFAGTGDVQPQSVAIDAEGRVLVAGSLTGTADCGAGALVSADGADGFLLQYSGQDGSCLDSVLFGEAGDQWSASIALDPSGDLLLGGSFEGSLDLGGGALSCISSDCLFLAKLTAELSHRWSHAFAGPTSASARIAVDPAANIAMAGSFDPSLDLGGGSLVSAGNHDVFVAKFGP
ncbi:MAG: hypothetical protein JRI23_11385 [Deltaproteobacteria bacterium]|nr:hypothetical protein [Deltaproteobacteria bacterium]MBW2532300.1 hypothetical protein [Deltaproteobacteria bacterium]